MDEDTDSKTSWFIIGCEIVFLLILSYWSITLVSVENPWIFLDGVNLMIHEGGHLIFSFAGQFIYLLAGSMVQILLPCLFFGYFFLRKDHIASAFSLFWVGDNCIYVSAYMKDAQTMMLDLVGGDIHDWNWIFSRLGVLQYDHAIGSVVFMIGATFVLGSLLYMAGTIGLQIRKLFITKS